MALQKINWTQIDTENIPTGYTIGIGSEGKSLEDLYTRNLYINDIDFLVYLSGYTPSTGFTITNPGAGRIITSDGTFDTINGEVNLRFVDNTLLVSGTVSTNEFVINGITLYEFVTGNSKTYTFIPTGSTHINETTSGTTTYVTISGYTFENKLEVTEFQTFTGTTLPSTYLKLDQSSPQTVTGKPIFDSIQYNTNYSITESEPIGTRYWDTNENTTSLVLPNGVILQDGQEIHFEVKNNTGDILSNGRVAPYAGTDGNSGVLKAMYGIADYDIMLPRLILGIFTQDIDDDSNGKVTFFGKVRGIDTTGFSGETWNNQDILYVHPTIEGRLTNVQPDAPYPAIPIAVVINANSNGSLFVRPTYPMRMVDLSDVNGTPLTEDGQFSTWNQANKYFDFNGNINNLANKDATIPVITGTTYTLQQSDNNKIIEFTSTSSVTVTLPTGMTEGYQLTLVKKGSGINDITILPDSGITLDVANSYTNFNVQHSAITLYHKNNIFTGFGAFTS